MKRKKIVISIFLAITLAILGTFIQANAAELPEEARIEITTKDGNGALLQKADGYVDAHVNIYDGGEAVINSDVQLKVRGNTTALEHIAKKAFTFKFDKKIDVLGMGKGKKWFLLANCFDPTLLRNYVVFDLAHELELPYTSEQRYVSLWLDGEFRGCYTLYEPVQEGKNRVDIDIESNDGMKDFLLEFESARVEDGVTYIKPGGVRFSINGPEEPTDEQTAYISGVMDDIAQTLKNGTEEEIRRKIDVDSFAKFYLLNEFIKNKDFSFSSVYFFYKDGRLYAGPPWDYDLSLGNTSSEVDEFSNMASQPEGIIQKKFNLYKFLSGKDWFQSEIRNVYLNHCGYFEQVYTDGGVLDTLRSKYSELFAKNFEVWNVERQWLGYQKPPLSTYEENYDYLKNWCLRRHEWLTEYYNIERCSVLTGDVLRDGVINIDDVTLMQNVLAAENSFNEEQQRLMDTDEDGVFTVNDITEVQRYLAGYDTTGFAGKEAFSFYR